MFVGILELEAVEVELEVKIGRLELEAVDVELKVMIGGILELERVKSLIGKTR